MVPTAAFLMLLIILSVPSCFHQDVITWTSNAPLLIARQSILSIAECSQNLHAGYTHKNHKNHTTTTFVRKHTRFKSTFLLPIPCRAMHPSGSPAVKNPLLYEKRLDAHTPSVSTAASTTSLPSTSSTNFNDDEALLLAKQDAPLVTRKFLPPSQRFLRTGVLAPTKTQLENDRKAKMILKTKAKEDEKAAGKLRKEQLKSDREQRRIHLAEERASKAASRAEAAQRALAQEVAKQTATSTDLEPSPGLSQLRKKSKSILGTHSVSSTDATQQYQSPQRKSTSENKRVSIRSPKAFSSDALSVSSGSVSDTCSAGVMTIGEDTSDSESSVLSVPGQGLIHTSSEPRGGRKHGTPQPHIQDTISDRYSTSQLGTTSTSRSDSSGSNGRKSTRQGAESDRASPLHGVIKVPISTKSTVPPPTSPPVVQRGGAHRFSQLTSTLDGQDPVEMSMLDGIWPGSRDVQLVQRFVKMHFADDWTPYLYFAQWADTQLSADPGVIVRLEDWLSDDEEHGGGRRLTRGRHEIEHLGGTVDNNSNSSSIACDLPSRPLTPSSAQSKAQKSVPRHADLRNIFPPAARIATQADHDRDAMVDDIIAEQERAELERANRIKARREQFEATAKLRVNSHDNPGFLDVEMEDAGHTPYPPPKRGSVARKSTQLSEHARKAKEADRIANTAQTLATSLKETLPKATTPTITKLHKREVKNSSPPLRATALFQNESLTKDIGRLRRDSVRFTPGLKSPPELMGVSSDFTELPRPTASPSITETASNGSTDRNASALHPSKYAGAAHNHIPINDKDTTPEPTMFSMAHRVKPGSNGETWFLHLIIDYHPEQDSKTTLLLGLDAMMTILLEAIDGFALHPVDKQSSLPILISNNIKEGFPSTAVLAFQYFLARDKRNRPKTDAAPPAAMTPSPHRFNDEEEYKAPKQMWGVIRVSGNGNIKEACDALAWDIGGSGLQIKWKEYQAAESSAQVILLNVPPILERGGVEEEITWHLQQIEKRLLKEGKLAQQYIGVPLPRISVSWRQSKQGKGRTKEERLLSLNLLGPVYQQNGCPVCTVEVEEGSWARLGPLWEIFHTGLSRRALGRKCLMVVMYNGKETGGDRVTMQRLRRVNVMYMDSISHMIIPYVAVVHKQVEVQMADASRPSIKFTDLSREFISLSAPNEEGKLIPMFDVIMPLTIGMHCGSAVVTYRHDNREAAILIRKIRQSVASWWYGYWTHVIKYKDSMIVKLMESFDTDAAKLAEYSSFDVKTLTVEVDIPDVDGRLDQLELDLGLNSWAADSEEIDGIRMSFTGHKVAVSKTLRDRPDDIFDCDRSGPSRRTDFSQSTGNSTNNSDSSVRAHKRRAKALKAIQLVDKNYALEAKVLDAEAQFAESQAQIASVLAELERYKQLHTSSSLYLPQKGAHPSNNDFSNKQGDPAPDRNDEDQSSDSDDSEGTCSVDNSDSGTEGDMKDSVGYDSMSEDDAASNGNNATYDDSKEEGNGPELIRGGSDIHSLCEPVLCEVGGNHPTSLCRFDQVRKGRSSGGGDSPSHLEGRLNDGPSHGINNDTISATDSSEYRQGFLGYIQTESEDTLSEINFEVSKLLSGQGFPQSISAYSTQGNTATHSTNNTTPASSISEITIANAQSILAHPASHYSSPPSTLTQDPSPRKSDGKPQSGRGATL